MRIFYAAASRCINAHPDSRLWEVNLYHPLVDLGHEVVKFDYDFIEYYKHLGPDQISRNFMALNKSKFEMELLRNKVGFPKFSHISLCRSFSIFIIFRELLNPTKTAAIKMPIDSGNIISFICI